MSIRGLGHTVPMFALICYCAAAAAVTLSSCGLGIVLFRGKGGRREERRGEYLCFLPASVRHPEAAELFRYLPTVIMFTLCFDSGRRSFHVSGDGCCGGQGLLCSGAGCWHRAGGHSSCPAG